MTALKSHKDLVVWEKVMELVTEIYSLTRAFPKEETFGLTSQIRRAVVSIPTNIAEGAGRNSRKEFIQFLSISLGSLSELETLLIIAKNLSLIEDNSNLNTELTDIRRMLLGLISSLKNR